MADEVVVHSPLVAGVDDIHWINRPTFQQVVQFGVAVPGLPEGPPPPGGTTTTAPPTTGDPVPSTAPPATTVPSTTAPVATTPSTTAAAPDPDGRPSPAPTDRPGGPGPGGGPGGGQDPSSGADEQAAGPASDERSPGGLARTGADPWGALLVGLALLAAGTALVGVVRRRLTSG